MARCPGSEKPEIFTQKDLDELRHNMSHLSIDAVRRFYERAHEDCRMVYDRPAVTETDADAGAGMEAVVEVAVVYPELQSPTARIAHSTIVRSPRNTE